jgi:hypothetical protein
MSGLARKRDGKIHITSKGQKLLAAEKLLSIILSTFVSKFNWAYFDRYENQTIGQFGAYYSIYLLHKYGSEKREAGFYANKYFKAFFKEYIGIHTDEEYCYALRTFERFLQYFGFIEKYQENIFSTMFVKKTALFDKYIDAR